ncbi:MAG: carboxypeptidase regulatory-like domain-containing protein [Prolixibacteraceae bacterium]|nr:carboxypeptidase regulatory-like domain-containing protein [Prolixibacteraceae bacterium]
MKHTVLLLSLLLLFCSGYTQSLTIDGKVLNMAGEPVVGATLTLNTPSGHQTTTNSSGYYLFSVDEFPTSVSLPELNELTNLQPGDINIEVFDISGRCLFVQSAQLTAAGTIDGTVAHENLLRYGKLYFRKISDKAGLSVVDKFVFTGSKSILNLNLLKSGVTDDYFDYQITIAPDADSSFNSVTISVDGFAKNTVTHTQDLIVNEFILINGDLKNLYFSMVPVTVDITDLFSNDNETVYSSNSGNISFAHADGRILMTYTPNGEAVEELSVIATDADDASITHEADFNAMKGKTLQGHAREVEWGKALDSVLVVAFDGEDIYYAYSGKDGNFNIVVPGAGNYDVYMEKDGFVQASNKYRVKEQDVTVFKRNNLFQNEFTKDPRFMDIFESMCHDAATNNGLSANFFYDDDDTSKFEINQNTMKDYLVWSTEVKPEWLEAQRTGIMKDSTLTDGLLTAKRFKFVKVNSVDEIDRSVPFAHTYIDDDDLPGRTYNIESKGIMNILSISLTPGLSGNLDDQINYIEHAANIEFLSGYIRQPFIGNDFPDGTSNPDKQSYFGYNNGAASFTPLDTMIMRARFDELLNVNKYGNHPNLNYSKLTSPLKDVITERIVFYKEDE